MGDQRKARATLAIRDVERGDWSNAQVVGPQVHISVTLKATKPAKTVFAKPYD